MRFSFIWNSLRVLAIIGLGSLLIFMNILYTVPSRRILFDLMKDQAAPATERTHERLQLALNNSLEVMNVNSYAVPMLAIVALLPYVRRKAGGTQTPERRGSGQSARTSLKT